MFPRRLGLAFAGALLLPLAALMLLGVGASLGLEPGSPAASPAASPVASPTPLPWLDFATVAGEVTIHLADVGFAPSHVEATNGHDLTVHLVNDGSRRHAFVAEHFAIRVELDPGQSTTVVIHNPDLGDFPFTSDAPGDETFRGTFTFYI